MPLLLVVSIVWAFSFGLIKGRLTGVDPLAVATIRLFLATLVFLPFLRVRTLPRDALPRLAAIGAIQFGIMYAVYLQAFAHLQAYEVALFTITTPLFITLIDGIQRRRLAWPHVVAAVLSVAGAGIVLWQRLAAHGVATGVFLVQLSNLAFAIGQLWWRRERARLPAEVSESSYFACVYAGGFAVSLLWSLFATRWTTFALTTSQVVTLLYLGILASGLCFFWWNLGATRVNTGTLAVFNNAKIPLAVACSLIFFGERTDIPRLLIGGVLLIAGVWIAESAGRGARSTN